MGAPCRLRGSLRWPAMVVLLGVPLGCGSSVVVGHGTPHAAPPTTLPAGCPPISPSARRATVDYVDAIEANGTQYTLQPSVAVSESELGVEQFRVRCSFAQLNAATHRETPNLRDGDATFLDVGTPVYAINGWSPLCRLAAKTGVTWKVYLALLKGAAVATVNPCALRQATPTTPSSSPSGGTEQISYEPFTANGAIDPNLRITKTVSGDCNNDGVAGSSSYRCFSQQSTIYDPCFARPGATSGPVICPTDPSTPDVVEFDTRTLPPGYTGVPDDRPWAIQLANGQVCMQVNAAWSGLGPLQCQPGPLADCHVPDQTAPWWTVACQTQLDASSPFVSYRIDTAWL